MNNGIQNYTDEIFDNSPVKGGNEGILIGEDNDDLRKILSNILIKYGYQVIEAEDGIEAVNKFKQSEINISLLILDVKMPEKNGKQIYNEIKKIKKDIKVIFTSGHNISAFSDLDGFVFLEKPVSYKVLLKTIREVLDEK